MRYVRQRAYTSTERAMITDLARQAGWKLIQEEYVGRDEKQVDLIFEVHDENDNVVRWVPQDVD